MARAIIALACLCLLVAAVQGRQLLDAQLKDWDQCGGKSGGNGNSNKAAGPWPGYKCPGGSPCTCDNDYYCNCRPQQPGQSSSSDNNNNNNNNNSGSTNNHRNNAPAGSNAYAVTSKPINNVREADGDYDYSKVLGLSILFYEAQRSGKLPANNRVPWRADSQVGVKAADGRDVSGGYYDAGDNVKFNLPMAWTIGVLAWSVVEFKDGYVKAGQYDDILSTIKWGTDYFIKCIGDGDEIVVQVGNGASDHGVWGRPEDKALVPPSEVYTVTPQAPGSDCVGAMAAALAAASQVFLTVDKAYSQKLLDASLKAYKFATKNLGFYSTSVQDAGAFYRSSNYYDDLSWAAAWLAVRTGDADYKQAALDFYEKHWDAESGKGVWNNYDWDSNSWGAVVLLSRWFPNWQGGFFAKRMANFIDDWSRGGEWVKYTPKGLAFTGDWGSLRHVGNGLFLMQAYVNRLKGPQAAALRTQVDCLSLQQLNYILGSTGQSYVVGWGKNSPQQPHHRAASCPPLSVECTWDAMNNPGPNPHTIYGALVGGPDGTDSYKDTRQNFIQNEVAVDYNGGFTGTLAAIVGGSRPTSDQCPTFPLPKGANLALETAKRP